MSGNEQRPGGWVNGIGWVAPDDAMMPGDEYLLFGITPIVGIERHGSRPSLPPVPVVVTRWADGSSPVAPDSEQPDTRRLLENEERARAILRGAGIEDHHGGGGESYYARPAWHMAEELVALWNDPACLADKLDSIAGEDEPSCAAAAHRVQPQRPDPDYIKVSRSTYEAEQAAKDARRREATEGATDPHPLEFLLRAIVDPDEAADCALAVIEAGMYARPDARVQQPDELRALLAIDGALAERMDEAHDALAAAPGDEYADGLFTAYQIARHFVTEQRVALLAASPATETEADHG